MNQYSDCYFVAALIRAIANTNTPRPGDTDKIVKQIKRYLNFESLIPSYHNVITIACLQSLTDLQLANKLPLDTQTLTAYTAYGNYIDVRVAAFECLALLSLSPATSNASGSMSLHEDDHADEMVVANNKHGRHHMVFDVLLPILEAKREDARFRYKMLSRLLYMAKKRLISFDELREQTLANEILCTRLWIVLKYVPSRREIETETETEIETTHSIAACDYQAPTQRHSIFASATRSICYIARSGASGRRLA